ncbi:MAG: doxx family protein [Flavobacteriales bacterium]|nr:MAG: doxx family protein [Flavobacteriales bacterium]
MKRIIRYIVGLIFIASGFVKTIDPKGFSFKLEEYFSPEVFNLPFLEKYVLPMAIFVSVLEVILGLMLLMKIQFKKTLLALIALCVFFAFLTFYSAYFNVVTDCGCFGDAIKLEPWQSFWKDIILLVALVYLWKKNKNRTNHSFFTFFKLPILMVGILATAYIVYYGIQHEPLIDFRDYKIGTDLLAEKKKLADDPSVYKTFYVLKNTQTNTEKEIDQDEYINNEEYWKEGSSWEIQDDKTTSKLIKQGYKSDIAKFNLVNDDGEDKTMEILNLPKVYLVCSYKNNIDVLAKTACSKFQNGEQVYGVTSDETGFYKLPHLIMDATAIKTIARSNPFVLVLEKGKIIDKKAFEDFKID